MGANSSDETATVESGRLPGYNEANTSISISEVVQPLLTPPEMSGYPKAKFELEDRYIDEPRSLKVVVIGAGLTGITTGALLPRKVPGIRLTIFEKNADVGGTWFENIYPGVRCDIPAHVYQSSFSPNTNWSEQFAQGAEIRDYWRGVAQKYGVYDLLKLSHKVEEARWDGAKWQVTVRDLATETVFVEEADYVLTAIGRFNAWRLPNYPGLNDFRGLLRHASHYEPTFDPNGKRIAVIGNGASGIQLVSNLQKHVGHLDVYARNKTWISASFSGDETSIEPIKISPELRATFKDPNKYLEFRKNVEGTYWRGIESLLKGSESNREARENFVKILKERLAKKPDLVDKLKPDFSPHCRRLTPGPGYLEALTEDHVDYIQTPIKRFTENGIETIDGRIREVDAIFCATGANVDSVPPFSIWAGDKDLTQLWREGGYPYTYLGLGTPGFPNLGFLLGPHGGGRSGTVPHSVEVQVAFFAKLLRKVSREGIKTIQPSKKAADEFVDYADAFFGKTVLSENCSSWYNSGKPGSRVHGLWPGSGAHLTQILREPRWEDWEYEYLTQTGNRFAWYFGKGYTIKELDPNADMTPYLQDPEKIDIRDLHESWWNLP
ncbi:4-hydroxyacetophenone monooxygenase [Ustulina deusta]|nr:4-hydroxyacetophenone monooxygenase [Ustulina deusta]KAI3340419.1 4-hydroxyacetophenone monooxygenase [Ustulina deusta]